MRRRLWHIQIDDASCVALLTGSGYPGDVMDGQWRRNTNSRTALHKAVA